jgi:hypothetical protein
MVASGRLSLDRLVSRTVALEEVPRVLVEPVPAGEVKMMVLLGLDGPGWIPALAGMTSWNFAGLAQFHCVIPAKAGIHPERPQRALPMVRGSASPRTSP